MAKVNLSTIKNWFKTGLKPTQEQFFSTWDSFWHKDDAIPAESIADFDTYLAEKADKEALDNHISSDTAHNTLFEEKVDKVSGKGLSENDYTSIEKQKLAGLNQKWENTANSNIKTIDSTKVAINRDEADFALDVGVKTTETVLTGTASFNGSELAGVGTLFSSELNNGDSVLLEDGQILVLDTIVNDTIAYSYSGSSPANSGVLKKVSFDEKLFNLQDVLQILRKSANNIYKNSELNLIGNVNINRQADQGIIKDSIITDTNGNPHISEYTQGSIFGTIQKIYKDTNGQSKFRTLFTRDNGTYNLTIECNGIKTLKIWENGVIELAGFTLDALGAFAQMSHNSKPIQISAQEIELNGNKVKLNTSVVEIGATAPQGEKVAIGGSLFVGGKINAANIKFSNLPTSNSGLLTGDVWNDNGILKIT